jgi:hypothetical protein
VQLLPLDPHVALREPIPGGKRRYRDCTPWDPIWTVEDLLRTPGLTRLARSDPSGLAHRVHGAALDVWSSTGRLEVSIRPPGTALLFSID